MFSQSEDYSQLSNGDYNFLHSSQSNSQFDLDAIPNKNPNLLNMGDLGTINEENPLTPIKLNFKDDSKKSLANNNQNISKSSKYSFTNNAQKINIMPSVSNIPIKSKKESTALPLQNKENINLNVNSVNINSEDSNVNNITLGDNKANENNFFNFDSYKCHLSQQIDQVEKIALQSMNNSESNNNKLNIETDNSNFNNGFINNISEEEILEHQKFNQYCSELIDQAMNKNLEYIDKIKNDFVNSLDTYKLKFRNNAEVIKKLILLYSDDIFQKEKNKIIISHLADQLLSHINSFFQEMSKFSNFNFGSNMNMTNNNGTSNQKP